MSIPYFIFFYSLITPPSNYIYYIYTVLYSIYILINSRALESWRGLYRQLLYIYTPCNTVIFRLLNTKSQTFRHLVRRDLAAKFLFFSRSGYRSPPEFRRLSLILFYPHQF
nr:MAG TPA_asm: hypothetical protein [Caudoviricetes sp.]